MKILVLGFNLIIIHENHWNLDALCILPPISPYYSPLFFFLSCCSFVLKTENAFP